MTKLVPVIGVVILLIATLVAAQQSPGAPIPRRGHGGFAGEFVAKTANVSILERLVEDPEGSPQVSNSRVLRNLAKDIRTMAFARLGDLATPEAIAAIRRIENRRIANATMTPSTVPLGVWPHPAWHMSSFEVRPLASIDTPQGHVAFVGHALLGGHDLYLITKQTSSNDGSWSRPRLTAVPWEGSHRVTARLDRDGRIQLDVIPDPRIAASSRVKPEPRSYVVDRNAIERDSDGDGWTDLEEARLGLNANESDTDRDGLADGVDVAPNLPSASEMPGEDAEILRRALFAVFAVGGSRHLLLVDEGVTRVAIAGYQGPMVFGRQREEWFAKHGSGGVFVKWRIAQRDSNEAVVEITDYEGPLAAGGQYVFLKKHDGRWFVVARETTWVS